MAMVLLLLLALYEWGRGGLLIAAIVVHVVNMIVPQVFRPVAIAWFRLAHVLGEISSRVLMFLVFALVVTPIGLVRRALGKDSLRLRAFERRRRIGDDGEKPHVHRRRSREALLTNAWNF